MSHLYHGELLTNNQMVMENQDINQTRLLDAREAQAFSESTGHQAEGTAWKPRRKKKGEKLEVSHGISWALMGFMWFYRDWMGLRRIL